MFKMLKFDDVQKKNFQTSEIMLTVLTYPLNCERHRHTNGMCKLMSVKQDHTKEQCGYQI